MLERQLVGEERFDAEPGMHQKSGWVAIVVCHDPEPLFEGCLVIFCGHAFCEIVGQHEMGVDEG